MKTSSYSIPYQNFRAWLKNKRESAGLSQRDLAPVLGIHFTTVGKMEHTRRKMELIEYVLVCQAIGADPHEGLDIIIESLADDKGK